MISAGRAEARRRRRSRWCCSPHRRHRRHLPRQPRRRRQARPRSRKPGSARPPTARRPRPSRRRSGALARRMPRGRRSRSRASRACSANVEPIGRHSGARRRREPGIHSHESWFSLATLGPRNDAERLAETTETALPRQRGRSHQELVDRVRALAAFADRPHHQRLAAAHVAGGEHLRRSRLR